MIVGPSVQLQTPGTDFSTSLDATSTVAHCTNELIFDGIALLEAMYAAALTRQESVWYTFIQEMIPKAAVAVSGA